MHFTPGDLLEDAAGGGGGHRDVVNVAAVGNIVACLLHTNLATVTPISRYVDVRVVGVQMLV